MGRTMMGRTTMIMVVIGDCGYVTLASMVGAGLTTILPSFF